MEKRHVKRLPVMDGEKLVGIITRADFIRALASFVSESYDELPRSDGLACNILSNGDRQINGLYLPATSSVSSSA